MVLYGPLWSYMVLSSVLTVVIVGFMHLVIVWSGLLWFSVVLYGPQFFADCCDGRLHEISYSLERSPVFFYGPLWSSFVCGLLWSPVVSWFLKCSTCVAPSTLV